MVKANARRRDAHIGSESFGWFSENLLYRVARRRKWNSGLIDYAVDADVAGEGVLVTYWTE